MKVNKQEPAVSKQAELNDDELEGVVGAKGEATKGKAARGKKANFRLDEVSASGTGNIKGPE